MCKQCSYERLHRRLLRLHDRGLCPLAGAFAVCSVEGPFMYVTSQLWFFCSFGSPRSLELRALLLDVDVK